MGFWSRRQLRNGQFTQEHFLLPSQKVHWTRIPPLQMEDFFGRCNPQTRKKRLHSTLISPTYPTHWMHGKTRRKNSNQETTFRHRKIQTHAIQSIWWKIKCFMHRCRIIAHTRHSYSPPKRLSLLIPSYRHQRFFRSRQSQKNGSRPKKERFPQRNLRLDRIISIKSNSQNSHLSGPLYPQHSQWAEDSQVFLVRLAPRFPEPIASGRLSESTKDEAKSTEGNLTNKGLSPD